MEIGKEFHFEASHILPNHKGKCGNLHGHSWELGVFIEGPIDPENGMVDDFYNIKQAVEPIVDDLDHAHLGVWCTVRVVIADGVPGHVTTKKVEWLPVEWSPTCENLLLEIGKQLIKRGLIFSRLYLKETQSTIVHLSREEFNHASRR